MTYQVLQVMKQENVDTPDMTLYTAGQFIYGKNNNVFFKNSFSIIKFLILIR